MEGVIFLLKGWLYRDALNSSFVGPLTTQNPNSTEPIRTFKSVNGARLSFVFSALVASLRFLKYRNYFPV